MANPIANSDTRTDYVNRSEKVEPRFDLLCGREF